MSGAPDDTILAVSSPPGRGAVSILRLSGREAVERVRRLAGEGFEAAPRRGGRVFGTTLRPLGCPVRVAIRVDLAPRSYTREDLVEILLPGSPPLVRLVAQALLAAQPEGGGPRGGALRWASAGEFTLRAFLNGRIDLSQAEAVASLIGAGGEAEARASRRALRGEFGSRCRELGESLIELIALLEVGLDFPDEDLAEITTEGFRAKTASLREALGGLLRSAVIRLPRPGVVRVAIAGFPNAGKSSLLNALLGREAAITSALPGTTRDPIRGSSLHADRSIEWIDLAGTWSAEWLRMGLAHALRGEGGAERGDVGGASRGGEEEPRAREGGSCSDPSGSSDPLAGPLGQILKRLTCLEIESSDLVLWVVDARAPQEDSLSQYAALPVPRKLLVFQKLDLISAREARRLESLSGRPVCVSARERRGIEELLDRVLGEVDRAGDSPAGGLSAGAPQFLVSAYEEAALRVAEEAVRRAELELEAGPELAAADLRDALGALQEVIGATPREAVLSSIFSRFCIGK